MAKTITLGLGAALLALAGACATSAPVPESTASSLPIVSRIDLSHTVGTVGEKFKASIETHSQRLGSQEVRVRSLPPGLRFDEESMTIQGVPKSDGFFAVTVAIRKKRGAGIHFNTPQGAWFSERLTIDIYKPIEDGDDSGSWVDEGADLASF